MAKNVTETINEAVSKQILAVTDLNALVTKHSSKIEKMLDKVIEESIEYVGDALRESMYDFDMYEISATIDKFIAAEIEKRLGIVKPKAAKKGKKARK